VATLYKTEGGMFYTVYFKLLFSVFQFAALDLQYEPLFDTNVVLYLSFTFHLSECLQGTCSAKQPGHSSVPDDLTITILEF